MAISEELKACSNNTNVETAISQTGAGSSDYIGLPQGIDFTLLELVPTGTARVEMTIDYAVALAGGVGVPWDKSDVTARTQAKLNGSGYLRIVNTSGDSKLIIKGVLE